MATIASSKETPRTHRTIPGVVPWRAWVADMSVSRRGQLFMTVSCVSRVRATSPRSFYQRKTWITRLSSNAVDRRHAHLRGGWGARRATARPSSSCSSAASLSVPKGAIAGSSAATLSLVCPESILSRRRVSPALSAGSGKFPDPAMLLPFGAVVVVHLASRLSLAWPCDLLNG